jgi:ribosomal protein S18 acetylase RimI-like enzyme
MIRRATHADLPELQRLLSQVLEIHATIRPDIFIPGTAKYTPEELTAILRDERKPVYVAVDESGAVVGYVFCALKEPAFANTMVPMKTLFIDDLCVDEGRRGQGWGERLFAHAVEEARRLGCYEVTLAVWEGNDAAKAFYEKQGMRPKETLMERIL